MSDFEFLESLYKFINNNIDNYNVYYGGLKEEPNNISLSIVPSTLSKAEIIGKRLPKVAIQVKVKSSRHEDTLKVIGKLVEELDIAQDKLFKGSYSELYTTPSFLYEDDNKQVVYGFIINIINIERK